MKMAFIRRKPDRYAPARNPEVAPRPWGGAVPVVQARYERAQRSAERGEFPLMASLIYAAPSVVQYPPEFSSGSNVIAAGTGIINRIYQPAAERPRTFGEKFGAWFRSGRFE